MRKILSAADAANARRDWSNAAKGYSEALVLDPELAPIWVQYGHSLKEQGSYDEAEKAYRRALALDIAAADHHLQLGHLLKLTGRIEEAATAYRAAAALNPDSEQIRVAIEQLPIDTQPVAPRPPAHSDDWQLRFKPVEFRALNPELTADVRTAEEALRIFVERGIDLLAPIAIDSIFDPDFYRREYPDAAGFSPQEAYRHWLFEGIAQGRGASEADTYQRYLIGRPTIPANLDWQTYLKRMAPRSDGARYTALDAVRHLLVSGYGAGMTVPTTDGDDARMLEHIADFHWGRGDRPLAVKALSAAIKTDASSGRLRHKLGDYHLALGDLAASRAEFEAAMALGYASLWTYIHLIDHALRVGEFDAAYALLARSRAAFSGETLWRRKMEEVIGADFLHGTLANREILKSHTAAAADAQLCGVLQRVVDAYLTLDDLPAPVPVPGDGHVVMFSLHLVPQCRHYRVEQRCEQFDVLGIDYRLFPGDQPDRAREALVGARALLIYREPAHPGSIRLILHARALGVPVIYEIDDLIFEAEHYPDSFDFYRDQIGYDDYIGLLQGRTLYRFAMSLCDEGIASTAQLATHMAKVVRSGRCHHVPNGLDSRNALFVDTDASREADRLFVFYGSGARAHNRNFNECAGPALVDLLRERRHVRLVIVGYLDLHADFAAVEDQIIRLDFSSDVRAYWSLLAKMDVNLALLTPGEMNDCKSEIKWLEAAVAGIPSVVSPSGTYRASLTDGEDVLFAGDVDEMRAALFRLVDDPALRRRIGQAAKALATSHFSLEAIAAQVKEIFERKPADPMSRAISREASRKTRVLIVNVFFAPQAFGGATRVVQDNVEDLRERHGDEFELAVFTTDAGGSPGGSRVGRFDDIPVFRMVPDLGPNPEWDYDRADVGAYFAEVVSAWRPDMVHFHCIQYLTGAMLTVCRERDIPYFVTVHDGWWLSPSQFFLDGDYFLHLPMPDNRLDERASGAVLPSMLRSQFLADGLLKAAAVFAVSESFAAIYRHAGIPKTQALPNGISAMFGSATITRRSSGRVRVGHIAGWAYHKGIHLFQAALLQNRFDNIEAVVIDHTREPSYRLETFWGTTAVTILGKVPQSEVLALYGQIDVLVAPSIWPESYGLVSREALHLGLWVIGSDLGAIAEDIVDERNGFVIDVSDARGLARALARIDENPAPYRAPPPLRATTRFSFDQADALALAYQEIVGRPAAKPRMDEITA